MVLAHVTRLDENSTTHFNFHDHAAPSGSKTPVYISDKRAKFSRKLNKKWVRVLTVIGYLISICIPAMALSVYYLAFWDPQYSTRILPNDTNNKEDIIIKQSLLFEKKTVNRRTVSSQEDSASNRCPPCLCKLKTLSTILSPPVSDPGRNPFEGTLLNSIKH